MTMNRLFFVILLMALVSNCEKKNLKQEEAEVDKNNQKNSVALTNDIEKRLEISSKYNWRTVPMIIINDNFVGGFDELNNLYSEGKLEELL